jgi:hypothetical protein
MSHAQSRKLASACDSAYASQTQQQQLNQQPTFACDTAITNMNTITHSTGEVLTGRLWRKEHSFFPSLPFYSNIPRIDDMTEALKTPQAEDNGPFNALLLVGVLIVFFSAFIRPDLLTSCRNLDRGWRMFGPFPTPTQ